MNPKTESQIKKLKDNTVGYHYMKLNTMKKYHIYSSMIHYRIMNRDDKHNSKAWLLLGKDEAGHTRALTVSVIQCWFKTTIQLWQICLDLIKLGSRCMVVI